MPEEVPRHDDPVFAPRTQLLDEEVQQVVIGYDDEERLRRVRLADIIYK